MMGHMLRLPILSAFLAAVLVAACGPRDDVMGTDKYENLPADQIAFGVEQIITKDGVRQAVLNADTVYEFQDSSVYHLRHVHLVMYDTDGRQASDLTADAGRLNVNTDAMEANGNVVLKLAQDSSVITTEQLNYDPNTHRVWSSKPTTRKFPDGRTMSGDGFTSDDQFRNYHIQRPRGDVSGIDIKF